MSSVASPTALELQSKLQGLLHPTPPPSTPSVVAPTVAPSTTTDLRPESTRGMRYVVGLVLCAAVLWVAWKWFSGHIPGPTTEEMRYDYDDEDDAEEDLGNASDDPMFQPFSD